MFSNYSFYINDIISLICKNIPIDCTEIHCLCEVEENKNSYSSVFYYKYNDILHYVYDFEGIDFFTEEQANDLIDQINEKALGLYDSFVSNDQPFWDAVEIHMINGKITGKFHYDWYKRGLGPFARGVVWAFESFGLTPEPGSYDSIVLERYLNSKEN